MSVTYMAYTVLGAAVRLDKYSQKEKAYNHDLPDHWKLDPVSGRKLWRDVLGAQVLGGLNFGPGSKIEVVPAGDWESDVGIVGHVLSSCDHRSCKSDPSDLSLMSEL